LGDFTKDLPKPLVRICGRPIVDNTFDALPDEIDEVYFIVNYLAEKIENYIKSKKNKFKTNFVRQKDIAGTAGALWQVRQYLKDGKFLILNGDDFYKKDELEQLVKHDLAMGLTMRKPFNDGYLVIDVDSNNRLVGWHRPDKLELNREAPMANGSYLLDDRIFNFEPVQMKNSEFGLPHTILKMAEKETVFGKFMDFWYPVNSLDDVRLCDEKFDVNNK